MPVHFQEPILYGTFDDAGEYSRRFQNRLAHRQRPGHAGRAAQSISRRQLPQSLHRHCGQDISRGDRLPAELRGDLLFAEPVGPAHSAAQVTGADRWGDPSRQRLSAIRVHSRDRPALSTRQHGHRAGRHPLHRGHVSGHHPGGAVDGEGSYLRGQIDALGLDHASGRGRIYRLTHDGLSRVRAPHMLDETPAQWVHTFPIPTAGGATPPKSSSSCATETQRCPGPGKTRAHPVLRSAAAYRTPCGHSTVSARSILRLPWPRSVTPSPRYRQAPRCASWSR